jgi:hypothetical protein
VRRAGLVAVTAAAALALLLSGCVPRTPHPTPTHSEARMTPDAARSRVLSVIEATQKAVGGSWRLLDGGADGCRLAGGGTGIVFPFTRTGPGVPAPRDDMAATVTEIWHAAGFDPVASSTTVAGQPVTQLRYPAQGYDHDGIYLQAWLGEHGSSIQGQSACVPGDADAYNGTHADG